MFLVIIRRWIFQASLLCAFCPVSVWCLRLHWSSCGSKDENQQLLQFFILFYLSYFLVPSASWLAHTILTVHKASIKFLTLCLFQWQRTLTGDQLQRYELYIYKYAYKAKSRAAPRLKQTFYIPSALGSLKKSTTPWK